jgi:hypothetical protein
MDVVKGDDVSGDQGLSNRIPLDTAALENSADAHVPRDNRVGDPGELSVVKVDIRATHFAGDRFQEDGSRFELRVIQRPELQRDIGSGHYRRFNCHGISLTRLGR